MSKEETKEKTNRLIIFTCRELRYSFVPGKGMLKLEEGAPQFFEEKEPYYNNSYYVNTRNGTIKTAQSQVVLADPLPVIAIFSYIFQTGMPEGDSATVRKSDVEKFLGVSGGPKGYRLFEKLKELQDVYAEVNEAWRPVVQITEDRGKYIDIDCSYLKFIKAQAPPPTSDKPFYYTKTVDVSILKERSHLAILIVIELAKLVACNGSGKTPNISIEKLTGYIPELHAVVNSTDSVGVKNQRLKRAFTKAYELMNNKDVVHIESCSLKEAPIPKLREFDGRFKYRENYVIKFTKKTKAHDENVESVAEGTA